LVSVLYEHIPLGNPYLQYSPEIFRHILLACFFPFLSFLFDIQLRLKYIQPTDVRGYKPIVISDCVASYRIKEHHWMALELMSRSIAWALTVRHFKEKIRAVKAADNKG
jgi:hypothetical protein